MVYKQGFHAMSCNKAQLLYFPSHTCSLPAGAGAQNAVLLFYFPDSSESNQRSCGTVLCVLQTHLIHDTPHGVMLVNMGFLQNPSKQHFGDEKKTVVVGQGGLQHQRSGGDWTLPLPHSSFRIPGWRMHSQKMKRCIWTVQLNRMLGRRTGPTSHTNTTPALHILQKACCRHYEKTNWQDSGMDEI